MQIVIGYPPNIKKIKKVFPISPEDRIVFTYGNKIYNPFGGHIDKPLEVHEATHAKQQGKFPSKWWNRYLVDAEFRLGQEVEAYQAQYKEFIKTNKDRNRIFYFVHNIARDLSGHIYGNLLDYTQAVKLIKL